MTHRSLAGPAMALLGSMKRTGWPVVLVLLVTLVAGCGSGGGDRIVVERFRPSGTVLGDGFSVPRGADLVVSRFPRGRSGDADDVGAWRARMRVTADPFDAWDEIAGQARHQGVPVLGSRDAYQWLKTPAYPDVRANRSAPASTFGVVCNDSTGTLRAHAVGVNAVLWRDRHSSYLGLEVAVGRADHGPHVETVRTASRAVHRGIPPAAPVGPAPTAGHGFGQQVRRLRSRDGEFWALIPPPGMTSDCTFTSNTRGNAILLTPHTLS